MEKKSSLHDGDLQCYVLIGLKLHVPEVGIGMILDENMA
jgi:hypothetical protein